MEIDKKLQAIQVEFKAAKTRKNSFGNYQYRSAEDILEAVKPLLKKHKCTITISESLVDFQPLMPSTKMVSGKEAGLVINSIPVVQSTATLNDTESDQKTSASALVGVDLNQKGMQTPQAFGAASLSKAIRDMELPISAALQTALTEVVLDTFDCEI